MKTDLIVAIPTVGISSNKLNCLLPQLKNFTKIDVSYVVSDDATPIPEEVERKRQICEKNNVRFIQNPDGDLNRNLNYIFNNTTEKWVLIFEDGMFPSKEWLEPVIDVINNFEDLELNSFRGKQKIGSIQLRHTEFQKAVCAGIVKTSIDWKDWLLHWDTGIGIYYEALKELYGTDFSWYTGEDTWYKLSCGMAKWAKENISYINTFKKSPNGFPYFSEGDIYKDIFISENGIPEYEKEVWVGYNFGSLAAVRREMWDKTRGYCPGYNFFEGYMGVKAYENNYICINLPTSPLYHLRSQGHMSVVLDHKDRELDRRAKLYDGVSFDEKTVKLFGKTMDKVGIDISSGITPEIVSQVQAITNYLKPYVDRWYK